MNILELGCRINNMRLLYTKEQLNKMDLVTFIKESNNLESLIKDGIPDVMFGTYVD